MNNFKNPLERLQPTTASKEEFLKAASTNVAITEPSVSLVKESRVIDLDSLLNEVNSVQKKEVLKPETTLINADDRKMLTIRSKQAGMTKSAYIRHLIVQDFKNNI